MAAVIPKFDFTLETPGIGSGSSHTSQVVKKNSVRPNLFNEYERVMVDLCEAIGNVDFEATIGGNVTDLSSAINTVITQNRSEFRTSHLIVDGLAEIGAIQLEWKQNINYQINDLVIADNRLYKCVRAHRSSPPPAIFSNDLVRDGYMLWTMIGGGGGTTTDVSLTSHGFHLGEVLFYYNGYKRAKANNYGSLGLFVVSNIPDDNTFTITQAGHFTIDSGEDVSYAMEDGSTYFTPNTWYYLSESQAGKLTTNEPVLSNPVLYAISALEAVVVGYRPMNITKSDVFEFTYVEGQTDYELDFRPDPFVGSILTMGGVVQGSTDYSFDNSILRINSEFEDGTEGRLFYLHSYATNVATSLEPYVFITSGDTNTFQLDYAPAAKEYTLMFVNGQGYWDYQVIGDQIITSGDIPEGYEVRILDIRALSVVNGTLGGVSDNTIPGSKLTQNSVYKSKLEPTLQAEINKIALTIEPYMSYSTVTFADHNTRINTLSGDIEEVHSALEGRSIGNLSGDIPVSNGYLSYGLNAEKLGGAKIDMDIWLSGDSNTRVATQHATKTYIDYKAGLMMEKSVWLSQQNITCEVASQVDWRVSTKANITLNQNTTLTFVAPNYPTTLMLKITQGNPASTITWPTSPAIKWTDRTVPTLSSTAAYVDIATFYFDGTNYYGTYANNFG